MPKDSTTQESLGMVMVSDSKGLLGVIMDSKLVFSLPYSQLFILTYHTFPV